MTITHNEIVFSVYEDRGQWKVAHCRNISRPRNPGPAIVKHFGSRSAALAYVEGFR